VGLLALFVMAVGLLACVQPALRAIRIRPAEVLKG
jgi:ABC-type lipoprotein release transport system permease subunit